VLDVDVVAQSPFLEVGGELVVAVELPERAGDSAAALEAVQSALELSARMLPPP
jgi:hypothetical protein